MGYLVIKVEGLSLEKFINLSVSKGIYLWKINRVNYTTLTASISISGFKQLHSICRKLHCRVKIMDKKGFPFVAHRYKHRKMLLVGMFIFLLILYGLSSFIWVIEVEGTEKVSPQKIVDELQNIGIKPGTFKGGIDTLYIENRLVINIREISWASLEIRGSKAIVRVAEAVLPPSMIDWDTPANIVAKRDGIIHDMIVLEGEAVVKVGETVRIGQLLVSGVIDHPDTTGTRYVHSMGQIMARTWYEGGVEISLKEPERKRTGLKAEIKYIEMGKIKIHYQKDEILFEKYDLVIREESFFPQGQFFPASMVVEEYYEVEEVELEGNIDIAKARAEKLAWEDAKKKIPPGAKIIDKKFKYDIIEGEKLKAIIYVEALEDIGIQKEIIVQ